MDLERAAQRMTTDVRSALKKLELTAKVQGKRISAKPKKGYICVLTVLEDIDLETQFVSSVQNFFAPIKTYTHKQINSIAQFIRSNGGVNYSIERIRDYLTIAVIDGTDPMSDYANSVYSSLLDVKASTSRRHLRTSSSLTLPYCAFCWRRVEDSASYCQIHHPNQAKRAFYKAKSALEFALKYTQSEYLQEYIRLNKAGFKNSGFSRYAFKWTASFSKHPRYIIKDLVDCGMNSDVTNENMSLLIDMLFKFIKKEYPQTYLTLSTAISDKFTSWQNFILFVVKALDPIEAAFWEAKDIEKWMNLSGDHPNIFVLLMVVHRHEAFQVINSFDRPRGPTKESILPCKKVDLRRKIEDMVQAQKNNGKNINRAEIARVLNLSRQRVSVLMKELKIE